MLSSSTPFIIKAKSFPETLIIFSCMYVASSYREAEKGERRLKISFI